MLISYSRSQRDPELTHAIGHLVNQEKSARSRTAERFWAMREQHRNLVAKYVSMVDVHTNGGGPSADDLLKKDTQDRREAVQRVRQ